MRLDLNNFRLEKSDASDQSVTSNAVKKGGALLDAAL